MKEEKKYPIVETFYSLQGEGLWAGTPMFFIRMAGCNLFCQFCDTKYALGAPKEGSMLSISQLSNLAAKTKADRIVLTGGEPLIHDLEPLVFELMNEGYDIHIETNGTLPCPFVDWLTVSPKCGLNKLCEDTLYKANEIKFLIGDIGDPVKELYGDWEDYINAFLTTFPDLEAEVLVMPIAEVNSRAMDSLIWENIDKAIQYCLEHPQFSLALQVHKILNVR